MSGLHPQESAAPEATGHWSPAASDKDAPRRRHAIAAAVRPHHASQLIDTHVHVWDLTGGVFGVSYPWPTEGPLHRTHRLDELASELSALGVSGVVLVQAADSLAETDELLRVATSAPVPATVVGWLPLTEADRCEAAVAERTDPALVGVRHLIHCEADPEWMLRPSVALGMAFLERAGLSFDAVAENPRLLAQLALVAKRHPELTLVLDHLGKPPITTGWRSEESHTWAAQIREIARHPRVVAKISGLNTASGEGWRPEDWQPFVDHALACFGTDRLMLGGDWPVCTLNGGYAEVIEGLLSVIANLAAEEQAALRHETARRIYGCRAQRR